MPSLEEKLRILGEPARYEVSGRREGAGGGGLFKVLMTNACDRNCAYCPARVDRDGPRTRFSPNELASAFMRMRTDGSADSLFLSSGVCGTPDAAMAPMVDTGHILRREGYRGYLHLKLMPGASDEAIRAAVEVADRVSVNLDTPNAARMACVDPERDWTGEVVGTLTRARKIVKEQRVATGTGIDMSTALVVGASGETDAEILETVGRCYGEWDVQRVHFGRFQPVGGTAMEWTPETPPVRVRRLVETDWLVRRYGFHIEEFLTESDGNLDPFTDPKIAVARRRPDDFPIEVTTADRDSLLRVPGIGELSARRILRARAYGGVRDLADLRAMGVVVSRAAGWMTVNGRLETAVPVPRHRGVDPRVRQMALPY